MLVVAALLYAQLGTAFERYLLGGALLLSLLALGTDLQWGYAGVLNLGPSASFGLGAYTYALVMTKHAPSATYAALLLAAAASVALALLTAYPAFKVKTLPIYYALITLAVALVLERYAAVSYSLTGGSNGITNIPLPDFSIPGLATLAPQNTDDLFLVILMLVVVCYMGCNLFVSSHFGRVLRAIREDEDKVRSLGYRSLLYKLVVVAAGAAMGGLGGALYAPLTGVAHPSLFDLVVSVQAFVWIAIGGQGSLIGPVAAALLLNIGQNYLRGVSNEGYLLLLAVVFVLAVIFLPRGLAGVAATFWERALSAGRNLTQRGGSEAGK